MQDMNVIENGMHFWAVITGICTRAFAVIPAKARIQVNPGRKMQCHALTDLLFCYAFSCYAGCCAGAASVPRACAFRLSHRKATRHPPHVTLSPK